MIEVAVGAFVIGLVLGGLGIYKIINYFNKKTQMTVIRQATGEEFIVLGQVTNTAEDRMGQDMVLFGNEKNEFFVSPTLTFKKGFRDKE